MFSKLQRFLIFLGILINISTMPQAANGATFTDNINIITGNKYNWDYIYAEGSWNSAVAFINPYAEVGKQIYSFIQARKDSELQIQYFEQILSAIENLNVKLNLLQKTTCNIYEHQSFRDYNAYSLKMRDYLVKANREKYFTDLYNLHWYITDVIKAFEDHTNLLNNCGVDQIKTFPLYMVLANMDLSIQAEYIRMVNYLAYRDLVNGVFVPIDQMDPALKTEMETIISNEIKTTLTLHFADIVTHIQNVAMSGGWRARTDAAFSPLFSHNIFTNRELANGSNVFSISGPGTAAIRKRDQYFTRLRYSYNFLGTNYTYKVILPDFGKVPVYGTTPPTPIGWTNISYYNKIWLYNVYAQSDDYYITPIFNTNIPDRYLARRNGVNPNSKFYTFAPTNKTAYSGFNTSNFPFEWDFMNSKEIYDQLVSDAVPIVTQTCFNDVITPFPKNRTQCINDSDTNGWQGTKPPGITRSRGLWDTIYQRHKDEFYMDFIQDDFFHFWELLHEWKDEIDPSIVIPTVKPIQELESYKTYSRACTGLPMNDWFGAIDSVSFNADTRSSGGSVNGYSDFTTEPSIALSHGRNTIGLASTYTDLTYPYTWKIWIDKNRDSIYSDSEVIFRGYGSTAITGTVNIPTSVPRGTTTMRIAMVLDAEPTPCGQFPFFGEYETYSVSIQ